MMRAFLQSADLATRALFHERTLTICMVLGLAAILAPLLVLFGLKSGVVSGLRERLERDPIVRVVQPVGQGSYDDAWFAELRAHRGVGFVVPTTRFLAATIGLRAPGRPDDPPLNVELLPTAPGDPMLETHLAQTLAEQSLGPALAVAVTRPVADRLAVAEGAVLDGRIGRRLGDQPQSLMLHLTVAAILPASASERLQVLVPLPLLLAAEDYREGSFVPALGAEGAARAAGARRFASFRLYADSIDSVAELRDWLATRGVQSVTHLAEIETVQRLDRDLGRLFLVLAGLGAGGFLLSLALGLWAGIARQRRALSLLRLIGFPAGAIALFPVVQGVWAALLSLAVACAATFAAQPLIEMMMAANLPEGARIFRLRPEHLALAALATLACTVLAAASGGLRAAAIAPAEGLRDD